MRSLERNNMKIQKGTFESMVLFCLSPFLSLPIMLFNIARGNRIALNLFALFLGIISYLFIPTFSNDKTRYIERYLLYKIYDFTQYLNHLVITKRPDFIFETLIYLFSAFNFNLHFLFFLVTSFTTFTVFNFILKVIDFEKQQKKLNIIVLFLLIFSFSLQGIFSGIRFMLGTSFLLWGVYYFLYLKKNIGILFFLLAIFTHYSLMFFLPAIVLLKFSDNKFKKINLKTIFIFSLLFLLLPSSIFSNLLGNIDFSEGYSNKINQYSQGEDFVSSGLTKGITQQFIFFFRTAWFYVILLFLLFNKRYNTNSFIAKMLLVFLSFVNITYSIPTIHSRYLNVIKIIFISFLIYEHFIRRNMNRKIFYLFFIICGLSFVIDIYLLRYNFQASLFGKNLLTIVNVLSNKFNYSDVL